jgi:hypothetical protein
LYVSDTNASSCHANFPVGEIFVWEGVTFMTNKGINWLLIAVQMKILNTGSVTDKSMWQYGLEKIKVQCTFWCQARTAAAAFDGHFTEGTYR